MPLLPRFEIVTTTMGATSIRNNAVGETMHNPVGPWAEANALYIEQSSLRQRLAEANESELIIFDVGLGAAANALAALHCGRSSLRPLRLVSFEQDLELLRFARNNSTVFAHFHGFESAIDQLLETGVWRDQHIAWELREGNFIDLIGDEPLKAQIIFFDPYSPTRNNEMWTTSLFKRLREKCADAGAVLYTYSRSTPIRVAMLTAGFYVGTGAATGLKEETTQAATRLELLTHPLDSAWLARWQRSHTPNAFGSPESDWASVQEAVLAHPQFCEHFLKSGMP